MADYIEDSDSLFNIQQGVIIQECKANATAWGIPATELTILGTKQTSWNTSYAAASNVNVRSHVDVVAKDDARSALEEVIRTFVNQWIANNPKVTNSQREKMGLTVKSETRTPVAVPKTFPVATVDFSTRLQHKVAFRDSATPSSKAKPAGAHGCEIWAKIGKEAPKSESDLHYLGTCTATPFLNTFDGEEAGETVHYWLRWVNTKGERGPWSTPVNAMVVA